MFDAAERRRGYWNAFWFMYFAADGIWVVYHKWRLARGLQLSLVWNYVTFRYWVQSSEYMEMLLDILVCSTGMAPLSFLEWAIGREHPLNGAAKYVIWWLLWQLLNHPDGLRTDRLTYKEQWNISMRNMGVILLLEVMRSQWWRSIRMLEANGLAALVLIIVLAGILDSWTVMLSLEDRRLRNLLSVSWILPFVACMAYVGISQSVLLIILWQGVIAGSFQLVWLRLGSPSRTTLVAETMRSWIIAPCLVSALSLLVQFVIKRVVVTRRTTLMDFPDQLCVA